MLDFKKILVPYDGSGHAKKALNQAISLAQCSDGAELYVATILNSTIPADDDPDQVDMAEVEKLIPENIPHKVLLEMGEPVPMLLYLAGEIGADLIITGSRGRGRSGFVLQRRLRFVLRCRGFLCERLGPDALRWR